MKDILWKPQTESLTQLRIEPVFLREKQRRSSATAVSMYSVMKLAKIKTCIIEQDSYDDGVQ